MCCDKLSLYLSFIVYAVGKNNADVEYIKLNADEGQQRFQVMMQPLYYGDERKICGVVETSVYNVFLIASASQCVENIASTALLFNSLDLEQLDKDFPSAKIVFVCDMKMQNNLLGLGPCSCRYPMALTLFSQNPLYSDEYRLRTVRMIVDDVREYETAKREEEAEQLRAEAAGNERRRKKVSDSSFHSVRSEPIKYLVWKDPSLRDVILHCPLHYNIGMAGYCAAKLNNIRPDLLLQFFYKARLRSEDKRSGLTMTGNESRNFFRRADILMQLLPASQRVELSVRQTKFAADEKTVADGKLCAARRMVTEAEQSVRKRQRLEQLETFSSPNSRRLANKRKTAIEAQKKMIDQRQKAVGKSEQDDSDDDDWLVVDDGERSVIMESYIQHSADARRRLKREESDAKAEKSVLDELRTTLEEAEANEGAFRFHIMKEENREPSPKRLKRAKRYAAADEYRHRLDDDDDNKNRRDGGDSSRYDGVDNIEKVATRRQHGKTKRQRTLTTGPAQRKKASRPRSRRRAAVDARVRLELMRVDEAAIRRANNGTVIVNNAGVADNENEDFFPDEKTLKEGDVQNFDPRKLLVLSKEEAEAAGAIGAMMVAYDEVIHATQSATLDPQFEQIIKTFEQRYLHAANVYKILRPPSRGNVNRDPRTPKFINITTLMVEFLRRHRTTLRRLDEQAFESQHHAFKEFVNKRRIARGSKLVVPTPRHEQRYEILRRAAGGTRIDRSANDGDSKSCATVSSTKTICIFLSSLCFRVSLSFLCGPVDTVVVSVWLLLWEWFVWRDW